MRKLYFLLLAISWAAISNAQSTVNYTFSTATNGSLTDMSTGTTQLLAGNVDDTPSPLTNIGFDFFFQGVRYAQFGINDNGVLRLGAAAQASTPYKPLGQAGIPIITAYGADQRTHTGDGKVHYKVIGSAPNRTLIVEWLNNQANFNTGGTADLTYQVRLSETTGVIEFVYGSMTMSAAGAIDANSQNPNIGFSSSNVVNSVGSVTAAQSGVPAPTYNGASATPVANLYTAGAITALTSASNGSRRVFTFTPPLPTAAPTTLNFSAVTALGMTLSWTDNASNEAGYAIYRSDDGGTTYNYVSLAAANATSSVQAGLSPSTNYFWRVFAVTEGALSTALQGSQLTSAPGTPISITSGLWSQTTTWSTGIVPTNSDNVTIADGHTVTIDVAAVALNLTVGQGASGVLQFEQAAARTLTVGNNVTIANGGTLQSNPAGTITAHSLSLGGNLTNNGTLDFSTNANTAGAGITFTGATNNTFGGTGETTDLRTLTINKGTSNTNTLELLPSNLSVQGTTVDGAPMAFLTLTNGTLKVSGTFIFTGRVFTAAGYTIGATTGLWLNNPNFIIAPQNGSPTLAGLLRITQGTLNVGTGTGNSMGFNSGSNINIEGGAVNTSGRFGVASSTNAITYNQTGGIITVCTVGNTSTTLGSFDLGTGTGITNISGGTIIVQLASTAASGPRDFRNQSGLTGTTTVTAGTVQFGNASSGAAKTFNAAGVLPNIVIDNTSAGHTVNLLAPAVFNNISKNITVNPGTTFNIGNNIFLMNGTTMTNNGTLTGNGASSNFVWFWTASPVLYTGSGVTTAPLTAFSIQADMGLTIDAASSNIVVGILRVFTGSIFNSNKIVVGNGGATTAIVQIGNTTTPTNAGILDSQLGFNPGTGGITFSYLRTTNSRTTGFEIPATRSITTMTYDDNDPTHTLTIAGGNLTATSAVTALALTNGRVITGSNTLIVSNVAGAVTRTTGYVDGNLRKNYAAAVLKIFEVGTANGYSPVEIDVAAGTFPTDITAKAVQGPQPSLNPATSLQRYWTLTGSGVTAKFTFNYFAGDVSGTEANYKVVRVAGGVATGFTGSTVNTATHVAELSGVTTFSDWTLSELCTGAVGGTATGDASFCTSGTPTITASGYSTGTATGYQWQSSLDNFATAPFDIPGENNPAALTTGVVSTTTYYRLQVTCPTASATDYSNVITVIVGTMPTQFNVTGGGAYCGVGGAPVDLSGSETGVNYQLQLNGSDIGAPVAGTGSAITFGPQTAVGNYTVVATSVSASCTSAMLGSVNVATTTAPVVSVPTVTQPTPAFPTGTIVVNATGGPTLEYSLNALPYQVSNTFSGLTPGNYNILVRIQNSVGCVTAYSSNPVVLDALSVRISEVLAGASPFQDSLWTINLADFSIVRRLGPVPSSGGSITGLNGLATHPVTKEHYAILKQTAVSGRVLAKINIQTGLATIIGNLGDNFSSITFRADGQMFGVTGDGATVPETMYLIDHTNATKTFAVTLGAGADGEVICYNPVTDSIYHWSGNGTVVFEAIQSVAPYNITNIPVSGVSGGEVFGAIPFGADEFIISNISSSLRMLNKSGAYGAVVMPGLPDDLRGLVREACVSSITTSGSTTICSGSNVVLNAIGGTGISGADYEWYLDGVAIPGANDPTYTATTAGMYNCIFTDGCGIKDSVSLGIAVSVLATADAIATPSSQIICSGSAITTIALTGSVPATVFNWTRDNTGTVTGIAASGAGDISGSLTNTTGSSVTVTFTITPTANGCPGTPITASVTVDPTPDVNTVADQVLCTGASTTAITFSGAVVGATYNWVNTAPSIGLAASGSGDIASFVATNTGTAPVVATITVTPTNTTAISGTQTFNHTGGMQTWTVPAGVTSITIDAYGAGGGTGADGGSVSGATLGGAGGKGTRATGTLAVTPGQVLNIFVGGAGAIPAAGFNGGGNGGNQNSGGGGGASDVRYPGTAASDRIIVGGGGGGGGRGGCESTNTINGGAGGDGDANGANGTDAPTSGGVAGAGGGGILSTGGAAGVGCGDFLGAPGTSGDVFGVGGNGGAGQACCCFSFASIPGGGGGGGGYLGGGGGGGGSAGTPGCSGNDKGAGGGGAGGSSYTGGVTGGSTTLGVQTGDGVVVITYNIPGATCTGTPEVFTITVNPTPNAVATPASQTVCSGNPISTIALTGNVSGTTYNWTRDNTGSVTGIAASGAGDISGTLTNTTSAPVTVTFTITPTANGCPGTAITATVLVNPTPTAVATPASQTVCSGPITTIVINGSAVSGTVYNWVRNNTVNVTGIATSGAGDISGTLTNTTAVSQTVTFTITPTANGCPGTPITATVIVNSLPTVTCPPDMTINSPAGQCGAVVTYPAATVTGVPAPTVVYSHPSGSTFPVGVTVVTVTATNSCGVATCTFSITVLDVTPPVITCPADVTVTTSPGLCTGVATFAAPVVTDNCTQPVSNTSVTWSQSGQRGAFFDVTNNGAHPIVITSINPQMFSPTPLTDVFSVYFTTSATTYQGNQTTAGAWTLNSTASVTVPGNPTTPAGVSVPLTTPLTLAPGQSKGVYVVGTQSFGGGPVAYLSSTGAPAYTGPQTYQNGALSFSGGVGSSGLFTGIFGTGAPGNIRLFYGSVSYGPGYTQTAGLPSGSVFPIGTTVNTFTATDPSGNTASCSFNVIVTDGQAPTVSCPASVTRPTDAGVCTSTYTPPAPTHADNCGVTVRTWALTGATTGASAATGINTLGSTAFNIGVTTVTYTVRDAANNTGTCSFTVTVTDAVLPVITGPVNRTVCAGTTATFSVTAVTAPTTGGPLSYQWQQWNGTGWVNAPGASTGSSYSVAGVTQSMNTNTFRVNVTGLCTTVASGAATLFVNPLPTISLTSTNAGVLLPGQTTSIVANVNPTGGTFAWFKNGAPRVPTVTGGTLSNLTVDDAGVYRATYTDLNGCVNTSADLVISAEVTDRFFLAPNPNFGQFWIRYYNQTGEALTVTVFDAKGRRVHQQQSATGLAYTRIDVDMGLQAGGIYVVELRGTGGRLLGRKQIIVGQRF